VLRSQLVSLGAVAFAVAMWSPCAGASDATQQLTIRTTVAPVTALHVSSQVLVFDVPADHATAATAVEYVASARTDRAGEVILSVETARAIDGPGGAADAETLLTVGAESAPLAGERLVVAERWMGSGTRAGRVVFTLRAAAAGRYVVPVRLVLSAP
jgi:hypothetical protein